MDVDIPALSFAYRWMKREVRRGYQRVVQTLVVALLRLLDPRNHGKAFVPLVRRLGLVPASVEIILVRDGQVYLTYRDDKFFTGWHTPGGYPRQRERYQDAVQRVAQRELGCSVEIERELGFVDHVDTPRFHDISLLVLCRVTDKEPQGGQWFAERPADLLEVHAMYWPYIEKELA
jgi:ADP-ribose pyrophosphatase YjhB (NUDIX family)